MRLNSLSASKIKSYIICPWKFYLEYHLGLELDKKFAAEQGSLVHEILEEFGKARRDGIVSPEITSKWTDKILEAYKGKDGLWSLSKKAIAREKKCEGCQYNNDGTCYITKLSIDAFTGCPITEFNEALWLVEKVINNDSPDNPLNKKIKDVENKFTLFIVDGNEKIPVVGIMDLVTKFDDTTIEINDYKTGNFIPSYKEIQKDPQPLMYHLAAREIYGEYRDIIVTFWYLKKGPISLSFSKKDEQGTIRAIKHYWHTIRQDLCPKRRCDRPNGSVNFDFKCKNLCNPTICEQEHKKFVLNGGIILDNEQTLYEPKKPKIEKDAECTTKEP